jgi:hypothetical protein
VKGYKRGTWEGDNVEGGTAAASEEEDDSGMWLAEHYGNVKVEGEGVRDVTESVATGLNEELELLEGFYFQAAYFEATQVHEEGNIEEYLRGRCILYLSTRSRQGQLEGMGWLFRRFGNRCNPHVVLGLYPHLVYTIHCTHHPYFCC